MLISAKASRKRQARDRDIEIAYEAEHSPTNLLSFYTTQPDEASHRTAAPDLRRPRVRALVAGIAWRQQVAACRAAWQRGSRPARGLDISTVAARCRSGAWLVRRQGD